MRDRIEPRVLLLEAAVVIYSFTAAAFRSDWPSIVDDTAGLVRLAIPVIAALGGLVLRDAFTDRANRPPHATAVDVMAAYGLAALAEAATFILKPELALPRWAPTQGGFIGMVLLALTRALLVSPAQGESPLSAQEAVWRADQLRRKIAHIRRAYFGACVVFGSIALYGLLSGGLKARIASAWILAGTTYLVGRMTTREARFDGSYREELAGYQAFVRRASYWYYGSLLPGITLVLVGYPVYPYWLPLMVLIAAELNHREAENLRRELDGLSGLHVSRPSQIA